MDSFPKHYSEIYQDYRIYLDEYSEQKELREEYFKKEEYEKELGIFINDLYRRKIEEIKE